MKTASPALIALLETSAEFVMADCFSVTLRTGTVLRYTSADVPVTVDGMTWSAAGVRVSGLKYRISTDLSVDEQDISILATPDDLIDGVPFLTALRQGVLDGAYLQRDRAFLTAWGSPAVGSVTLAHGRISTIDKIGRVSAQLKVKSDLVLLDIDMPRNLYQASCLHTLFDTACGLIRAAHTIAGVAGSGSTTSRVAWSNGSPGLYDQGALLFTSGANAGTSVTIKTGDGNGLTLVYPLDQAPAAGDAFTVSAGCDHALSTCRNKFNNASRFRGFPNVPQPEAAY